MRGEHATARTRFVIGTKVLRVAGPASMPRVGGGYRLFVLAVIGRFAVGVMLCIRLFHGTQDGTKVSASRPRGGRV
ncbi:hypothetical protein GCM10023087_26470 [Microbacterium rhizosphaerae]